MLIFSLIIACGTPLQRSRSHTSDASTSGDSTISGENYTDSGENHTENHFEMIGDILEEGSSIEINVHDLVNHHRISQDMSDLVHHSQLMQLARFHSEAMALEDISFGHDGFDERYDKIVSDFDFSVVRVAENVGYAGIDNAGEDVVGNWLDSDGHRDNIEGPFHYSGIGSFSIEHRVYVTQIFVRVQ